MCKNARKFVRAKISTNKVSYYDYIVNDEDPVEMPYKRTGIAWISAGYPFRAVKKFPPPFFIEICHTPPFQPEKLFSPIHWILMNKGNMKEIFSK